MSSRKSFAAVAAVLAFIPFTAFAHSPSGDRLNQPKNNDKAERITACIAGNNSAINYIAVVALRPQETKISPKLYSGASDTLSDAVVDASGANPIVLGLEDPHGKIVGYVEIRSDGLEGRMSTRKVVTAICEANPAIRLMDEIKNQVVASLAAPSNLIDRQIRDHNTAKQGLWQALGASGIKPLIDQQQRLTPGF